MKRHTGYTSGIPGFRNSGCSEIWVRFFHIFGIFAFLFPPRNTRPTRCSARRLSDLNREAQDKHTRHVQTDSDTASGRDKNKQDSPLFERRQNDVSTTCAFEPSRPGEGCVVGPDCLRVSPISKGQDQREDLCVHVQTSFVFCLTSFA